MDKNEKLLLMILLAVLGINFVVLVGKTAIDFIVDKKIESLKKDYTPSPYGPEFDSDKMDVKKIYQDLPKEVSTTSYDEKQWVAEWEKERLLNQ